MEVQILTQDIINTLTQKLNGINSILNSYEGSRVTIETVQITNDCTEVILGAGQIIYYKINTSNNPIVMKHGNIHSNSILEWILTITPSLPIELKILIFPLNSNMGLSILNNPSPLNIN